MFIPILVEVKVRVLGMINYRKVSLLLIIRMGRKLSLIKAKEF